MKNLTQSTVFRTLLILFIIHCSLFLAHAQLINNKGNRTQSYPVITHTKPEVLQLINQVDQDIIESHIRYMQQYFRVATSPEALIVQNWLVDQFESYGYDDISIHKFTYNSQELDAGNVVVIKKGIEFPDEYIMITSHYDHSTGYMPVGPGADDNASGTAGVLECARLLKDYDTKRSIMFVPFNAEEFWMVGSLPFAQKCAAENMNIIAHFNMDMIGWFPPENPNLFMASGYSYISQALFNFYEQTANIYVPSIPTIRFSKGDSYGGDHMVFNMYEYPSLYIGDIEDLLIYPMSRPCYHKPCDTIGPYQIDIDCGVNRLDLAKAFVQAVLSASAELANAWLPPQNLSACSGMDNITVSWDKNNQSTLYKIYKNDTFVIKTTENFYVDNEVELGEKYMYYVIAVNNETGQETAPSNKDEVTFVTPLPLPYSNNFSENKYGFEQSDWILRNAEGVTSLCNTDENGSVSANYLSIAELDWFPIPNNIENLSIRFKWKGLIEGHGMFFEVTNDRKTWHKLAFLKCSSNYYIWEENRISLNSYISSDFFQARFRLESSGELQDNSIMLGYITDVEIGFAPDTVSIKEQTPYISSFTFSPNPASNNINLVTNQQEPYHIAIYDMTGRAIFVQEEFRDGMLSVAHLKAGSYLIVASTKQHRIARKLVVQ